MAKTATLRTGTTRKAARKQKAKPTRESLLIEIDRMQQAATALMAKSRKEFHLNNPHQFEALVKLKRQHDEIFRELDKLLNPEIDYNAPDTDDIVFDALAGKPGEVPAWGRSGQFVMWIDYVAVLCRWNGILRPFMSCVVADPGKVWLDSRGSFEVHALYVRPDHISPADVFRASLAALGTHIKLEALDDEAKGAAVANLEHSPWLREALAKGPVNPIPLPRHLRAIQQKLFD